MSEKYRTTSFYNGVSSFKAAFPQLTDAYIEWRERSGPDAASPSGSRKLGFRRGNFTQGVVPCSNPACHEGGYQVDRLVAEMIQLGQTEREGMLLCSGREIGEEVRRGPIRCPYRMDYKATLTFRTEDEPKQERKPFHRRGRNRPPRRNSAA